DSEVSAPVTIEVRRHKGTWSNPDGIAHRVLKGTVAIAQQHRDRRGDADETRVAIPWIFVGTRVEYGEVDSPVAVEVARHNGVGVDPRGVGVRLVKRSVAVAQ